MMLWCVKIEAMRNAYALLGLSFLIVFVGAYIVIERANAPTPEDVPIEIVDTTEDVVSIPIEESQLSLTSPSFIDGGLIPSKYTCDGENISPELRIENVPEGTVSMVLVMDDPDIPDSAKERLGTEKFDHWVLYSIPPSTTVIPEGGSVGSEGLTTRGEAGYVGSCPPDREHRYIYRLYALSGSLNFITAPTLDEVEIAAEGMTIASTTLMGLYERIGNEE